MDYFKGADGIVRPIPETHTLSTDSVINFTPNRPRMKHHNNPTAWPQEVRENVMKHISPIDNKRTLKAIEQAIQVLDIVRMWRMPTPEEISGALRELRAVRVEHLKEIG